MDKPTSSTGASQAAVPIKYDEIVECGTHVTGIARIISPSGQGNFEMRVSGSRQAVVDYGERAAILTLEFAPITPSAAEELMQARRAAVLDHQRAVWNKQLDLLREIIGQADLDLLADPERVCQQRQPADKAHRLDSPTLDLTHERYIQIRPLGKYEPGARYRLSLALHPYVPQGRNDVYEPYVSSINEVYAEVQALGGDPDLYLYRGGRWMAQSASPGPTDAVYAQGGYGAWRLYVYGYVDTTYTLSGDWVLLYDDVPW